MLTLLTSDRSTKKDVQRWTATPIKRAAVDQRWPYVTGRHHITGSDLASAGSDEKARLQDAD
jgi:hypothetical protein